MDESEEDYEDYYGSSDMEEEYEFRPEIAALERAGGHGLVGGYEIQIGVSPLEKFTSKVEAISRRLMDYDLPITSDEIYDSILEHINRLPHPETKNADAYVLGFIASKGGRELEPKYFETIIKKGIHNLLDDSVKPADVLRYARFWISL